MILPFEDRFSIRTQPPDTIRKGFDALPHSIKGYLKNRAGNRQTAKRQRVLKIVADSHNKSKLSDSALRAELKHALQKYAEDYTQDREACDLLLCLLSEVSARTLQLRPYPEQLIGALVLQSGGIAEMATGEGKSLTAAVGAAVLAAKGLPVHVVTANDYLAERDALSMAPFFNFFSMDVGAITSETQPAQRKNIYNCAVVYTTAKELLGDFLRDRLKIGDKCDDLERAVRFTLKTDAQNTPIIQRGLFAAVIDEADNVLIDEAVTPLILSVERENNLISEATFAAHKCLLTLKKNTHYQVLLQSREIRWTHAGEKHLKTITEILPKIWRGRNRCRELMTFALQARELYHQGEHYVIDGDKIVLIDILTGRLTPNKNLGIGLQQAVEVKEGLPPSPPTETIARFSFQRFFRLFPHLCGMSGTVKEASRELWKIYNIPIIQVPSHRPVIRKQLPSLFFTTHTEKLNAIIETVSLIHATGQPVLVGTRTVETSEELASMCSRKGIKCNLLNAVHHKEEAAIVAKAGQEGAVTIATNMAGRGTDIQLGKGVQQCGGLFVLIVEPQTSRRLDRQLLGRAGRQGDPGCGQLFASADDILIRGFTPKYIKPILRPLFAAKSRRIGVAIDLFIFALQKKTEHLSAKRRMAILLGDDWIDKYLSFPGTRQ